MKNTALQAHRRMIRACTGTPPRLDFIAASLFGNFRTTKMHVVVFILQTVSLFFIFCVQNEQLYKQCSLTVKWV